MPIPVRLFVGICFIFFSCMFTLLACACYCRAREQLNNSIYPEEPNVKSDVSSDSGTEQETVLSDSDNPILNV